MSVAVDAQKKSPSATPPQKATLSTWTLPGGRFLAGMASPDSHGILSLISFLPDRLLRRAQTRADLGLPRSIRPMVEALMESTSAASSSRTFWSWPRSSSTFPTTTLRYFSLGQPAPFHACSSNFSAPLPCALPRLLRSRYVRVPLKSRLAYLRSRPVTAHTSSRTMPLRRRLGSPM